MPDQNELWEAITSKFSNEFADVSYNSWIASTKPISFEDNKLTLLVESSLHLDFWNKNLIQPSIETIKRIFNIDATIKLVLQKDLDANIEATKSQSTQMTPSFLSNTHLNSGYTFENFVTGGGNQMAYTSSLAVSESPGNLYNPLFIYGGVGLGKTHLMQAIGNRMLADKPNTKIKYVTSETFTNDFINSIKNKTQDAFRQEYRNADLLLIDDVQFFGDKEGTQEEFFHTFNDLYNNEKQIVLTSDRLPNEIPKLQERLVSRFKSGLPIDVTSPDLETRIAILRNKAEGDHLDIPSDTLTYIAGQIDTNVRELEAALIRVQAFATIKKRDITTDLAASALASLTGKKRSSKVSIKNIQQKVARYYDISLEDLTGKKRNKGIVHPRHIAIYLSRIMTDASLPKIGQEFGGKDHSTILNAFKKIESEKKSDLKLSNEIDEISKSIQS